MHEHGAEKRSVVILWPHDWEEWLTTSNVEASRAMLQLYPAGGHGGRADDCIDRKIGSEGCGFFCRRMMHHCTHLQH